MNNRLVFVVFLPIFTFAAGAQAQQRPLVTEDPETIGPGRVLIEGGVEFDFDQTNPVYGLEGDITHFATLGVSVGLGPSAEVQVDGGFLQTIDVTRRIPAGLLASRTLLLPGDSASSLEDFVVATKIRFTSETESRPALGLRFGAKLPMADPENGIGLGTTDVFTSLLIAKTVQSVRIVGNAGLILLGNPQDGQDTVTALGLGFSVARAITNEFEMVVEMNGRRSRSLYHSVWKAAVCSAWRVATRIRCCASTPVFLWAPRIAIRASEFPPGRPTCLPVSGH
jgi:hypothetical protein